MIEAIVLAGGFGTRLRSVVSDVPKPMAPIGEKPFLAYVLQNLSKNGVTRVIVSAGYMSEKIVDYFGHNFFGMDLIYSIEDEPLGTGGAIREAMKLLNGSHAYIFNGDTYLDFDLSAIEREWQKSKKSMILGILVDDVSRYGSVKVDGTKVVGFVEKGLAGEGYINAGCYVFDVNIRKDFACFPKNFSIESDFLMKKYRDINLCFYKVNNYFIDIGIPDDYSRAIKYFGIKNAY
jgi:D-glycero-alpha-D-manno-heptose 1-phosphate guanylyltransferase